MSKLSILLPVLLLITLSAAAVGCGTSGEEPTPVPTNTASPALTPTPVPTPTPTPVEAQIVYEIVDSKQINMSWRRTSDCSVTIRNTGSEIGNFRIEFNLSNELGMKVTKVVWQVLEPDEQKEVTVRYDEGFVDSFTYSVEPTPLSPPAPTTKIETWNVSSKLSGLSITLTTVHWRGDEVMAEWVIENSTGQAFDRDRLYSIFSVGAIAVDQAGNESEYFIPERFERNLQHDDIKYYETTWLVHPESEVITVRLRDLFTDGSNFVDASAEFVFSR